VPSEAPAKREETSGRQADILEAELLSAITHGYARVTVISVIMMESVPANDYHAMNLIA
jgi:hypothetical protein